MGRSRPLPRVLSNGPDELTSNMGVHVVMIAERISIVLCMYCEASCVVAQHGEPGGDTRLAVKACSGKTLGRWSRHLDGSAGRASSAACQMCTMVHVLLDLQDMTNQDIIVSLIRCQRALAEA